MLMSVRSVKTCLELSIFIFFSQVSLRSVSGQSQVSLRSVSGQSRVSLRSVSGQSLVSLRSLCAYFVRQTEPKILRLVLQNSIILHIVCFFPRQVNLFRISVFLSSLIHTKSNPYFSDLTRCGFFKEL